MTPDGEAVVVTTAIPNLVLNKGTGKAKAKPAAKAKGTGEGKGTGKGTAKAKAKAKAALEDDEDDDDDDDGPGVRAFYTGPPMKRVRVMGDVNYGCAKCRHARHGCAKCNWKGCTGDS